MPLVPIRRQFRLRTTLIVPFVVQILAAVGLVGYLSFRNGQKAVGDLATQLSNQVSHRIDRQLDRYLEAPRQANEINLQAIELGMLKPQDLDTMGRFLWQQMKLSEHLSYINFGSPQGAFIGIGREDDGWLYTERMQPSDGFRYRRYALDDRGNPTKLLTTEDYPFQDDEWYRSAVAAGKPIWSPIYQWGDRPEILSISSSYPVYDASQRLVGVLGVDFILSQISDFLRNLYISPSGKVFVIERDGAIVASSSTEKPYLEVDGKAQRLNIAQSQEPFIRYAARELQQRFGSFDAISTPELLSANLGRERAFVSVMPWQDELGLNWLVVVVIPESDFMKDIDASTYNTVLLCLVALETAIAIGILTARWVTRPILEIADAAENIAGGDLDQYVAASSSIEVARLATSFNHMASQMKDSFNALRQSEARNRALLNAIPDLLVEVSTEGLYLDAIASKDSKGLPIEPQDRIGKSVGEILPVDIAERYQEAIDRVLQQGKSLSMEYELLVDGEMQAFEARVAACRENSALFLIRNISDRKRAEEALRLANEELERRVEQRTAELFQEKERAERLLLNVLPEKIAERLKHSDACLAEHFEETTILFADIVGFTSLATRLEPMQLVNGLNQIFSAFDHLTERHGLEKIKTIGDAYMVVGGLPTPRADHAMAIAEMALDMQAYIASLEGIWGKSLQLRIGINTGPAIAGVIGIKKFTYDLWGDAVNVASRMESHGKPGFIQVTDTTYAYLKSRYLLEPRGKIFVKGRGDTISYWLLGRRSSGGVTSRSRVAM